MEYKIIHARSIWSSTKALETLTRAVMEAMSAGWEPVGGIAMTEHGQVAQAMIKRR